MRGPRNEADPEKKTLKAAEQDRPDVQEGRRVFAIEVAALAVERLVFLDEFGCNTAMARRFARALQGQRAYGSCPLNYGPNVSVAGAVRLDGVVAAMVLDGAFDGEAFLAFTTSILAPALQPGDVVVMDNLASHKVKGVITAIEAVGARVMYLPPYSPDFNPIEMCWSKVKAYLRAQAARTSKALDDAIARGLDLVTLSDLRGWFQHCGYGISA